MTAWQAWSDQPFALERLHHVFDLVVIQHGDELTNDLFDAVTYPQDVQSLQEVFLDPSPTTVPIQVY